MHTFFTAQFVIHKWCQVPLLFAAPAHAARWVMHLLCGPTEMQRPMSFGFLLKRLLLPPPAQRTQRIWQQTNVSTTSAQLLFSNYSLQVWRTCSEDQSNPINMSPNTLHSSSTVAHLQKLVENILAQVPMCACGLPSCTSIINEVINC